MFLQISFGSVGTLVLAPPSLDVAPTRPPGFAHPTLGWGTRHRELPGAPRRLLARPAHAAAAAAGVRAGRRPQEVPPAPAGLGPRLRLGVLVAAPRRRLPHDLLRRLRAGRPALLGLVPEVPALGARALAGPLGADHDGDLPERREHWDQAQAVHDRVDPGDEGARAPGEHEPRDALPRPPPHRARWHVDRAVPPAMAPILALDDEHPRPRPPRVPPRLAAAPGFALAGRPDKALREGGVGDEWATRSAWEERWSIT